MYSKRGTHGAPQNLEYMKTGIASRQQKKHKSGLLNIRLLAGELFDLLRGRSR
jgi:hypothetical protein